MKEQNKCSKMQNTLVIIDYDKYGLQGERYKLYDSIPGLTSKLLRDMHDVDIKNGLYLNEEK